MTILRTLYRQVRIVNYSGNSNKEHIVNTRNLSISSPLKMSKKKVYLTRPDIPVSGLEMLKERCEVISWTKECPVPRCELLKQIQGVDALFCMLTDKIDKEVLDRADLNEVKSRGIKLGYTPEVLTDAVAELTIALLLATSRRLGKWSAWAPTWMCGPGLKNATVGVVGFGRIGQEVSRRLKSFNVGNILYSGRSDKPEAKALGATRVPLDDLLAKSDFVIVACALTPETKEMFNDEAFAKMKDTAIFINSSRGVIIPHIGSATIETRDEMAVMTAQNILAALDGQPMPAEVK
ncbi:Glyoxylate reductase/hydroxypyruvate reductase [Blattella germanica]|nr:Glyoxylate reductase/hydroxypyruvate reductase [Blattella germanica]